MKDTLVIAWGSIEGRNIVRFCYALCLGAMTLLPFFAIVKKLNLYTFKAYLIPCLSHEEFLIYNQVHYVLRLPQKYEEEANFFFNNFMPVVKGAGGWLAGNIDHRATYLSRNESRSNVSFQMKISHLATLSCWFGP